GRYAYCLLLLALVPLVLSLFLSHDDLWTRVMRSIKAHPESQKAYDAQAHSAEDGHGPSWITVDELLSLLLQYKLDGALLTLDPHVDSHPIRWCLLWLG